MLYNIPSDINSIKIKGAFDKLLIRFGNLIIYIVFWSEDNQSVHQIYEEAITKNFNFVQIGREQRRYKLRRVSASTNMTMNYVHLLSTSALYQDDMLVESTLHGQSVIEARNKFESLRTKNDWKKSQLMVERDMFPNNRKVQKQFDEVYGKNDSC